MEVLVQCYSPQYNENDTHLPTWVNLGNMDSESDSDELTEDTPVLLASALAAKAMTEKENAYLKKRVHEMIQEKNRAKAEQEKAMADLSQKKSNRNKRTKYDTGVSVQLMTSEKIKAYVRSTLFRYVKYNEGPYKEQGVKKVFENFNIAEGRERERVKNQVMQVIDDAINSTRNNGIKNLKKTVWPENRTGGGRKCIDALCVCIRL